MVGSELILQDAGITDSYSKSQHSNFQEEGGPTGQSLKKSREQSRMELVKHP